MKKGSKHSDEAKQKMKLAKIGYIPVGAKHTEEWKLLMSEMMRGEKNHFYGKKHSEETKKKISLAQKGKKLTEEQIEKFARHNKGRKMPDETRIKISQAHKKRVEEGTHHFWKGGITPINAKIRTSIEYKLWRKAVFERDNFTCVWCGARTCVGKKVYLNADHIKPFCDYPELRFAIDNGRTLCVGCHKTTENYGVNKRG